MNTCPHHLLDRKEAHLDESYYWPTKCAAWFLLPVKIFLFSFFKPSALKLPHVVGNFVKIFEVLWKRTRTWHLKNGLTQSSWTYFLSENLTKMDQERSRQYLSRHEVGIKTSQVSTVCLLVNSSYKMFLGKSFLTFWKKSEKTNTISSFELYRLVFVGIACMRCFNSMCSIITHVIFPMKFCLTVWLKFWMISVHVKFN